MTTRQGRDRGLTTVRKATIWVAGGAVLAVGAFAALFGHPLDAGAKSNSSAPSGGSFDGSAGSSTSSTSTTSTTRPRSGSSGSSASSAPRSSTTITPPTTAPRATRRRPSVSSGGS